MTIASYSHWRAYLPEKAQKNDNKIKINEIIASLLQDGCYSVLRHGTIMRSSE